MEIYLSATNGMRQIFENEINLSDVNILESFVSIKTWQIKFIHQFKNFMLDSGAFTLRKKPNVNLNDFVQSYIKFINENDVKLFFELDIDNIIGLQQVEEIRKHIETQTKKQTIPVWHPNRGKKYFEMMCDQYEYVSLGGVVNCDVKRSDYMKTFPWFIDYAHKTNTKIHGLGVTQFSVLKKCHFDSVDSSTWINGGRFGELHLFKQGQIQRFTSVTNDTKTRRLKNTKTTDAHNLNEWIKASKWASLYL